MDLNLIIGSFKLVLIIVGLITAVLTWGAWIGKRQNDSIKIKELETKISGYKLEMEEKIAMIKLETERTYVRKDNFEIVLQYIKENQEEALQKINEVHNMLINTFKARL